MNTKIKQTIALFFTVMLLFVLVLPPLSAAADASPIKVGYYEDGDYMSKSQSGEYSGYNIEYLQKISKQSGLSLIHISEPTRPELVSRMPSSA